MARNAADGAEVPDGTRSRRTFLRATAGGAAVAGSILTAGCLSDIDRTDEGDLPVRRCIASLEASDPDDILPTFADAVEEMRALDDSDPRSWENQAEIHGDLGGFNDCRHGDWLFLPWHRAYLFYFEEICRELTGNDRFALPYWNWIENPELPSIFEEDGGDNPLYVSGRTVDAGEDGLSDPLVGDAAMDDVLQEPNFERFAGGDSSAGDLENPPHDHVHVAVGGTLAQGNSPLDPVFWVHHCFVDYLWWEWNAVENNPNTNDGDWVSAAFDGEFVDADGDPVDDVSVFETLLMPLVSYEYEECAGDGGVVDDTEELRTFLEEGADVELNLLDRSPLKEQLEVRESGAMAVPTDLVVADLERYLDGTEPGRIEVAASEIDPPERDDLSVYLYVEYPGAPEEPSPDDAGFAGGLAFFVAGEGDHHVLNHSIDVTDTIRRLRDAGELEAESPLEFQLVSAPFGEPVPEHAFTIGQLDLEVTQSVIDGEIVER